MRSDEDGTEVAQKEPHQRLMVYRYVSIIASSVRRMNTQLWLNQEQNAHCADRRLQKTFSSFQETEEFASRVLPVVMLAICVWTVRIGDCFAVRFPLCVYNVSYVDMLQIGFTSFIVIFRRESSQVVG